MKLEFNPWSGTNAAGAIIAAVSPCLLALNWETDSWSVWRTPFSIVLTLGIVMMASYRRIEVRPDRSGFEVRSGLWPLVFRTQSTTCVFKAVVLDAYYQRTVQFTAHLEYSGEKIRRVKLLNNGFEVLRLSLLAAEELGIPIELTPAFVKHTASISDPLIQLVKVRSDLIGHRGP